MQALPSRTELPKAQTVRLMDVFILGPLMLWGGLKLSQQYPARGNFIAVSGAATIAYNGYNFLRLSKMGY